MHLHSVIANRNVSRQCQVSPERYHCPQLRITCLSNNASLNQANKSDQCSISENKSHIHILLSLKKKSFTATRKVKLSFCNFYFTNTYNTYYTLDTLLGLYNSQFKKILTHLLTQYNVLINTGNMYKYKSCSTITIKNTAWCIKSKGFVLKNNFLHMEEC